jgi:hypothetical protein
MLMTFLCVATFFIGGYYRIALGYKPLSLQSLGNPGARYIQFHLSSFIFWLACLVLLAKWTAMYNNSIYWGKTYLAYLPLQRCS